MVILLQPEYGDDSKKPVDYFGDSSVRDHYDPLAQPSRQPSSAGASSAVSALESPDSIFGEAPAYESRSERPPSGVYSNTDISGSTLAYSENDAENYPGKALSPIADEPEEVYHNTALGDLEYAEPEEFPTAAEEKTGIKGMFMNGGRYPLQQRIEDKKRGIGRQKYPVVGTFACSCVRVDGSFPFKSGL